MNVAGYQLNYPSIPKSLLIKYCDVNPDSPQFATIDDVRATVARNHGEHRIVNCGSGLSNEECAAQVALTNFRLLHEAKFIVQDDYPHKELLKRTANGMVLKP